MKKSWFSLILFSFLFAAISYAEEQDACDCLVSGDYHIELKLDDNKSGLSLFMDRGDEIQLGFGYLNFKEELLVDVPDIDIRLIFIAAKYFFQDSIYLKAGLGKFEVHEKVYSSSHIDIDKSYLSLTLGFKYDVSDSWYIGGDLLEYIMKLGGQDGYQVTSEEDQSRLLKDVQDFGGKNFGLGPIFFLGYVF